jgi:hypothetical protein
MHSIEKRELPLFTLFFSSRCYYSPFLTATQASTVVPLSPPLSPVLSRRNVILLRWHPYANAKNKYLCRGFRQKYWLHICGYKVVIPMIDVPAFSHHKECDWLTSRRYYKFYFDLTEE